MSPTHIDTRTPGTIAAVAIIWGSTMKYLFAALAFVLAQPAQAVVVIDQDARLEPAVLPELTVSLLAGQRPNTNINTSVTQTVTAGLSGILVGIAFDIRIPSTIGGFLRVSLIDGDYGSGGAEIFSGDYRTLFTSTTFQQFFFPISDIGYRVNPGQVFQFRVESADPTSSYAAFLLAGSCLPVNRQCNPIVSNHYAGGSAGGRSCDI
jgi:hypothetical protein